MTDSIQMVPLGALLKKSGNVVFLEPNKLYKEVTVRLWGKGVALRGEVTGAQIAADRRFAVRPHLFILSRIDARNGAFGLVPESLDGAIVSADFPVFDINLTRLLPEYLEWLSKTSFFVDICKAASEGTTNRVRLKEDRFLSSSIPLPSLLEQQRLVARIEELTAKIEEARRLRQQASRDTVLLRSAILDNEYVSNAKQHGLSRLEEVCNHITDGDHVTPTFVEHGVKFIFVGNVSSGYLHFDNCKHVTPEHYASISPYRKPAPGDILYSAVGATLGIPTLVNTSHEFCFQRHIAIIKPDRSKIEPQYLRFMLLSDTIYRRAWSVKTGTAQPTVPLRAIRALPIPTPPISEQLRVIERLEQWHGRIDALMRLQTQTASELDSLLPSVLDRAFKGEL